MRPQQRRTTAILVTAIALSSCKEDPPIVIPQAEREEATKALDEARKYVDAAESQRREALGLAIATLVPRTDLGTCPIKVPFVGSEAVLGKTDHDLPADWRTTRANQMSVVSRAQAKATEGALYKYSISMLDFERQRLEEPPREPTVGKDVAKWARYYGGKESWTWEMTIVANLRVDPKKASEGKFGSGLIVGRAFVYDFVQKKVVCAAEVRAQNSELLYGGAAEEFSLKFDLENEAYRAAARALVMAGPKR